MLQVLDELTGIEVTTGRFVRFTEGRVSAEFNAMLSVSGLCVILPRLRVMKGSLCASAVMRNGKWFDNYWLGEKSAQALVRGVNLNPDAVACCSETFPLRATAWYGLRVNADTACRMFEDARERTVGIAARRGGRLRSEAGSEAPVGPQPPYTGGPQYFGAMLGSAGKRIKTYVTDPKTRDVTFTSFFEPGEWEQYQKDGILLP